jgi:hypothetical protein
MADGHPDQDKVDEIYDILDTHKAHRGVYNDELDGILKEHIGDKSGHKTLGELYSGGQLKDMAKNALDEYLNIIEVSGGKNARRYLEELTLSDEELKEFIKGREDMKYTVEMAAQMKDQFQRKISQKLQRMVISRQAGLEDKTKAIEITKYVHKEAGVEDQFPNVKDVATSRDAADLTAQAWGTYQAKIDQKYAVKKK